ncbi:hypothetical protein H6777_02420 [Candidatus Nomurabacteria bacterium]|nr:hypothetical protein [Candidatus Nomurabacteria bacterium]
MPVPPVHLMGNMNGTISLEGFLVTIFIILFLGFLFLCANALDYGKSGQYYKDIRKEEEERMRKRIKLIKLK